MTSLDLVAENLAELLVVNSQREGDPLEPGHRIWPTPMVRLRGEREVRASPEHRLGLNPQIATASSRHSSRPNCSIQNWRSRSVGLG